MLSMNTIKPISSPEASFKVQRQLYSRNTFTDFKFWLRKNDIHAKINVFAENVRSQSVSLKSTLDIRQHSVRILKSWSQQFEYAVTNKFNRSRQLVSLYNKWWGNLMSNIFLQRLTSELLKRRKFYFAACSATIFQWGKSGISDRELTRLETELDKVKKFSEMPNQEEKPTLSDADFSKLDCECNRCKHLNCDGWSRLYVDANLIIWRKEHVDHPGEGLYVYKVYGHYPDVTAADFFRVQIDVDYRKKWDSNSIKLNIIESDSKSNSDILYWEFLFPRMFYNRDYVFNRRFSVNPDKKLFTIICQSVDHPNCPEKPPVHRVKEYWSHTVIRSTANSVEEPGIEFTVTYFDNPEINIPTSITLWYSVVGMPDYIKLQRAAALTLADIKAKTEKLSSAPEVKNKKEKQQTPEKRVLLL